MTDEKPKYTPGFHGPLRYSRDWVVRVERPGLLVVTWTKHSDDPDGSKCLARAKEMAAAREMAEIAKDFCLAVAGEWNADDVYDAEREFSKVLRRAGLLDDGGEG